MSTRQALLLRNYGLPLAAWLFTATLVACNDAQAPAAPASTSASTNETTQPAAAQAGGVLKIALEGDPQCLDPQQAGNNTSLNIGRQVVDSLTDQDPNSGAIVPWLAQNWEVDPDSRRFSFTLRQDARFSDGSAVDAAAVKANFENILALGARSILGSTYLAGLKSISTPTPYQVVVEFEQPNTQFLQASSTMSLGLLAPATLARTAGERCQGQLIGSGAFTLQDYVLNQRVTLKRRADYAWASALAGHQGPAWLEGIEWLIVPESGVRLGSLASGQVQVNSAVAPQDEASLAKQGLLLLSRANPGVVFNLAPNEKHGVFSELKVRQAFNKAINRAELQSISSGQQKAATALLASSTPYYRDFSSLLAYDPQGARQLLDEAGWQLGADGIRHKDGQRLSVRLDYWQATLILELVQQHLRQVGIDLQLNKSTLAQVTALQASGDYSLRFLNLTRADPDVLRTLFDASGYNINQRPVSEVDQWLQASAQTLDHEQRQALIDQASEGLLRDGHAIALLELTTVMAHSQAVRGLHYEASSRLQLYDTWLAE
jgi:peptide/nickel transport system substrate-binding protein